MESTVELHHFYLRWFDHLTLVHHIRWWLYVWIVFPWHFRDLLQSVHLKNTSWGQKRPFQSSTVSRNFAVPINVPSPPLAIFQFYAVLRVTVKTSRNGQSWIPSCFWLLRWAPSSNSRALASLFASGGRDNERPDKYVPSESTEGWRT